MKHLFKNSLLAFLLLYGSLGTTLAQNIGGAGPQVGETSNGEVSLDTLNVHLAIPIVSKAGIGVPVSVVMTYDSNVWYPVVGGYAYWYPGNVSNPQQFWHAASPLGVLVVGQSIGCGQMVQALPVLGFTDASGSTHRLDSPINLSVGGADGNYCTGNVDHATVLLTDGSGLTLNIQAGGGYSVVTSSGVTIQAPSLTSPASGATDADGNTISLASGSTTTLTDTLEVQGLSYNSWCSASGSQVFTYPTSTGTANVTVNCTNYTLQTNFGCANITEYGPNSGQYLPTTITVPDGTYTFTYESLVSGTITGRISSVTYPSGKVTSYLYTGANHGINCADGSSMGLTVTKSDAVSQYTRNTSAHTTTLVSDYGTGHANNTSVFTFAQHIFFQGNLGPYFLTQTVENQGTGTQLRTTLYCYNTNQTNCATTAPVPPLTQTDVYSTLAGMSASSRISSTYDSYGNVTMSAVYDFGAGTPTRKTVYSGYGYTWNGSTSSPNCTALIGNSIMNKTCRAQLETGAGAQLRNVYSQYSPTGHAIKIGTLVNGSYVTTSATYNANGSIASSTDANSNPTTVTEGDCNGGVVHPSRTGHGS